MALPNSPEAYELVKRTLAKMTTHDLIVAYAAMINDQNRFRALVEAVAKDDDVIAIPCHKRGSHD